MKVIKRENRGRLISVTECITCDWHSDTDAAPVAMRLARAHIRENPNHVVVAEQAVEVYLSVESTHKPESAS